jgi:hypothetical protein
MKGFIFRWGQRVKDIGEQMAHIRLFGIPILRPFCGPVISLGLAIRNGAMKRPVKD